MKKKAVLLADIRAHEALLAVALHASVAKTSHESVISWSFFVEKACTSTKQIL